MKYEYFDVTADVGVKAYGATLNEVFENAAIAVFQVMCDTTMVAPRKKKKVLVRADDLGGLLCEWLTQLLGLKDIYGMMFSRFKVHVDEEKIALDGEAWGEETREKHSIKTDVKAVTYHMMEVKKNDLWRGRFILDV